MSDDSGHGQRLLPGRWALRGHPVTEAGAGERDVLAVHGDDAAVVEHRTEIAGPWVGHHLAWIASCGEPGPDEVVHAVLVGVGDIDHPVDRIAGRRAGDGRGDIRGSNRLERPMWRA